MKIIYVFNVYTLLFLGALVMLKLSHWGYYFILPTQLSDEKNGSEQIFPTDDTLNMNNLYLESLFIFQYLLF